MARHRLRVIPTPARFAPFAIWLVLAAFALGGCRAAAETIARELYLNLGVEPATLDPALATDPGAQQVARMLFLSLVDTDPATGAPQHALANSWAVSPDGMIWEFKLRSDAVWVRFNPANNRVEVKRQVTAQDVVYGVRRVFDPRVGSGFAATFAPLVRGAEQVRAADPKMANEAAWQKLFENLGVQAMDDITVRFTLTRPASYFPALVSTWLVRTQPREAIEESGIVWTEPGKIWTTGPYLLERWSHGREIVLLKNPHWYDAGAVQIQRIHLVMYDSATALSEYRNGNLDSLDPYGGLANSDWEILREDPVLGKHLHSVATLCTHYYGFNTAKPPFNEVLVRKAFIAAIDRETLASSVIKLGEPARWFTRPGIYASGDISDTLGVPFNVNQARAYLRDAGYDNRTKRLPTITLGVNSNDTHERIAETIVQMWKNNLGVEVRVNKLDWKSYLPSLRDDAPQMFRLGYCAYYPDAANFGGVFQARSADNFTRWSNPQFDQWIDAAAREVDLAKRRGLYRAAEKMLVEDQAIIAPLWWTTRLSLSRPTVHRTFAITDGYERFETWSFQ